MAGFNYLNSGSSGRVIDYLCLGGDRQSWLKKINLPASAGTASFTGFGFQPECVIFYGAIVEPSFPDPVERARLHLGVATAVGEQWSMEISGQDNVANAIRVGSFNVDSCLKRYATTGPIDWHADFVSFDADGFTLDVIEPGGSTIPIMALALRGGGLYKAGVSTVPVAGGSQVIEVGFEPDAMFFASTRKIADGFSINMSFSMGAADDTGRQGSNWMGGNHDVGLDEENTASISTGEACLSIGEVRAETDGGLHGQFYLRAQAEIVTFGVDDVEIDWTTFDGNEYLFGWLAVQNAATDNFETVTNAISPGTFVETPLDPRALLAFNCSCTAAQRSPAGDTSPSVAGAAIGISVADHDAPAVTFGAGALHEMTASAADFNAGAFGFQQTSSWLRGGVFGCMPHQTGGFAGVSIQHLCNIIAFDDFIPQIYRRVIQR